MSNATEAIDILIELLRGLPAPTREKIEQVISLLRKIEPEAGLQPGDEAAISAATPEMLWEWRESLNTWRWPSYLPAPAECAQQYRADGRRSKLLGLILDRLGGRVAPARWRLDLLSPDGSSAWPHLSSKATAREALVEFKVSQAVIRLHGFETMPFGLSDIQSVQGHLPNIILRGQT